MKRCPYCGNEYPNSVRVCPFDQQRLVVAEEPRRVTAQPDAVKPPAFNARLVSHSVSSGKYRIFLRSNDLLFIQVEPGEVSKHWGLISALLGSAGVVFSLLFSLWSKKKARAALSGLDEREPEDLLHANESNFRLCIAEIRDAALEPSGRLALSGTRAGRLKLLTYDGRKFNLEFPDADEMRTALDLLSPRLNLTLRVNVEWNKNEQRFQRKVTTAKGA